jgi:hypothetical protein
MKSVSCATDIYSAMWPLHFISRIFGLAPYSLKPGSQSSKYSTFITCHSRMWSIFCLILLAALEIIYIIIIIYTSPTLKEKVTNTLFATSICSHSIINIFQSLTISGDKVGEILRKFSKIDLLFSSKVYRNLIYKNTRLFLTLQFAIMILVIVIFEVVVIYVIYGYFRVPHIFAQFSVSFPIFVNSTGILYFANLVLLLRNKYKYLNSVLESSAFTTCDVPNLNYRNMNCVTPIDSYRMKPSLSEVRENCNSSRRKHLRNLRIIYSQLHDVAVLINSTYGFSLLCATVLLLISNIPSANFAIELKSTKIELNILLAVLRSSFSVALMTVMAVSCSLAVNECNRSPVICRKLCYVMILTGNKWKNWRRSLVSSKSWR